MLPLWAHPSETILPKYIYFGHLRCHPLQGQQLGILFVRLRLSQLLVYLTANKTVTSGVTVMLQGPAVKDGSLDFFYFLFLEFTAAAAEEGFSFEDSDRFDDESLCSWMSEPESVCTNWRGWRKQNTSLVLATGIPTESMFRCQQ